MKDETYVFIQDVKEKASTARSARNRRTHNGKGGKVKFPSDHLTEKEKKAMSGEVKSYRLNDPMPWKDFKGMPDDIKGTYIKLLIGKFGVSNAHMAKMFGVHTATVSRERIRLGVPEGKRGRKKWDKAGWLAWCNGEPIPECSAELVEETFEEDAENGFESLEDTPVAECEEKPKAIPCSGNMTFEGRIEEVLNTISALLGGANVHISITWDVLPEMPKGE